MVLNTFYNTFFCEASSINVLIKINMLPEIKCFSQIRPNFLSFSDKSRFIILNEPYLLFSERILVSSDLWIITDGMRKNDNFPVLERLEQSTIQQLVGIFVFFILNHLTILLQRIVRTCLSIHSSNPLKQTVIITYKFMTFYLILKN